MATQHDINEDINRRLEMQDEKLDRIAEDVAYMKGLMDGKEGAPIQQDRAMILNKQNAITVALAGLITTIGSIMSAVFVGGK